MAKRNNPVVVSDRNGNAVPMIVSNPVQPEPSQFAEPPAVADPVVAAPPRVYELCEFGELPVLKSAQTKTKTKIDVISVSGKPGTVTVPGEPSPGDEDLSELLRRTTAANLSYKCGKKYVPVDGSDKPKQTGATSKIVRGVRMVPFIASTVSPAV